MGRHRAAGGNQTGVTPTPTLSPALFGKFLRLLRRLCCCLAGVAAACAQAAAPASAPGTYPTRAVRLIVPLAPSGGTDIMARSLAQRMTESTGQQFVVENRPGCLLY